ncbi:HD domain-containing protein [Halorubellus sp. JP-L1]|uniref:HD domain-containing protein n=1 Tax=Halorubellus sp. JP-L1 TaxID=2715753 RepID=UPI00140E3EEE|nr:HD domain-containing protein [Halorubellus sp. JP-L1]NHN43392.1 HD domain-containing protein [Halorubellus sp. JP-L1]
MDETAVRDAAREYFDGLSPCHDVQHVRRVVATAKRLADATERGEHGPARDVDRDVLVAAAWLHDVGRAKESRGEIDDHAAWGASESRTVLRDLGERDDAFLDAVAHCVRAHRFSNDVEPETLEAELLCDADNLDATGAVGVARVFAYAGEYGNTLHDPDLPPAADDSPAGETSFNHFHKKILELADRTYTPAGRALAADRQAYVEEFLDRFEREARGDA